MQSGFARLGVAALTCTLFAGVAMAQLGVHKLPVQKRIFAMKDMADDTKVLGRMAKGQQAFDAATAQRAIDEIAAEAGRIPALFKAFETEAGSDARTEIWSNYPDFTARAAALQKTAAGSTVRSPADLSGALNRIGAACKSCHQQYRK